MEDLLSVTDVAHLLGASERTVYRLMEADKLHPFKMGKSWKFDRSDVDAYVASERKKSEVAVRKKREQANTRPRIPAVKRKNAA